MITTLVRKELREHWMILGVGLFASLALSAVFLRPPLYSSFDYSPTLWIRSSLPVPIVNAGYQKYFYVVCYSVAVLLGLLMTWKETVRKTWPFLLHRPVTRTEVFSSKLIAGAMIYLVSVGLPFGLLALWSSIPGNFPAPWCADYLLPGITTLTCGYALFLAAFVVGMWPGGYVARFTPLIAMGLLVLGAEGLSSWLSAALISSIALFLGLGAATAIFLSIRGLRWTLALLTGTGVGVALVVVIVIGISIYESCQSGIRKRNIDVYRYPRFTREGEPVMVTYNSSGSQTVKNLDGTIVEESVHWQQIGLAMSHLTSIENYARSYSYRAMKRFSIQLLQRGESQHFGSVFSYLHSKDGVVIVYASDSRKPIYYIGLNGFVKAPEEAEPFVAPRFIENNFMPWTGHIKLAAQDGLYLIDEKTKTVKKTRYDMSSRIGIVYGNNNQGFEQKDQHYIQTADRLGLHNREGKLLFSFILPDRFRGIDYLQVGMVDEETLAVIKTQQEGDNVSYLCCKVNRSGKVLWEQEFKLPGTQLSSTKDEENLLAYGSLIPGVNLVSIATTRVLSSIELTAESQVYFDSRLKPVLWLALSITLIKAFACALVTFLFLGRWSVDRNARLGWSVFAFAGGIPGMLAVFVLMPVEKRVACPACGASRLPSAPVCPGCAAAWPKPESRDTDLFAIT